MLPTNIDDITPAQIQALIDSEVAESLTLEYKEKIPTGQSEEKREFLYDVAAMANAVGGDIVFGIVDRTGADSQSTGVADRVEGIKIANEQSEITRLSNLIRDCIAPRLVGIRMQPVRTAEGDVLVIRIPQSWHKPHMVIIDRVNKFYIRTATGKALMSVEEIRRAFSEQRELRETITRWREHRVTLMEHKRGPVILEGEVSMLFHIIPANAFTPWSFTEAWRLSESEKRAVHVVTGNYYQRYNADGFLCHSNLAIAGRPPEKTDGYLGYTQLFRSGIAEYAFSHFYGTPIGRKIPLIDGLDVEQTIVKCYEDAVERYQREGRVGMVYVGFSLVGIEDKQIFTTPRLWAPREFGIRQNTFTSPEVMVDLSEPEERPYTRTLRPLVDTFWQLDGREGTPFAPNGEWTPFARYQ